MRRTYMKCPVCEKEIGVDRTWLNRFCMYNVLSLKMHSHIKKEHNKRYLKTKWCILSHIFIVLGYLLSILFAVIWVLTFIPWVIHEMCE